MLKRSTSRVLLVDDLLKTRSFAGGSGVLAVSQEKHSRRPARDDKVW